MNKTSLYIIIALLLLMISGYFYLEVTHNNKLSKKDTEISEQKTYIDSLEMAKTKDTTIRDTILVPNYITVVKWEPADSFLIYKEYLNRFGDKTTLEALIRTYKDSLQTKDFTIPYEISVNGYLEKVVFGNYSLVREEKIKEHIVKIPVEVVREIDRSHLYFYFALGSVNMENNLSLDFGFNYIFKNRWGLGIGYQRLEKTNVFKFNVNLKIL